ncbi:MAG: hypothetical protein ACFNLH_09165 [Corynebacterium matruchotii]
MFESVERHDGGVTVRTQDGKTHEAEVLLIAVGRGPATANLGYEEVGVSMDRGFVLAESTAAPTSPAYGPWATSSPASSSPTAASPRASSWRRRSRAWTRPRSMTSWSPR